MIRKTSDHYIRAGMTLAGWCIQALAQEPLGPRLPQAEQWSRHSHVLSVLEKSPGGGVLIGSTACGSTAVGRASHAEKASQRQPQAEDVGTDDVPRTPARVLQGNAGARRRQSRAVLL
jgi:hypothetical protein